jgi:hypothetical protein
LRTLLNDVEGVYARKLEPWPGVMGCSLYMNTNEGRRVLG